VGGGSALYPAVPATAVVGRRTYVQVVSSEAWRSREWRRAMDFHAEVLGRHLADGLLDTSSRVVCFGGPPEALALRELGVSGAVAVAGDDRRLPFPAFSMDFVFAGRALDSSTRLADLTGDSVRSCTRIRHS
jgi:hypothetical protein